MSDFDSPQTQDLAFRKKPKKHGREWMEVEPPEHSLDYPIADTHAHINMLNNPELALAQASVCNLRFIEAMCDPLSSEGLGIYDDIENIVSRAKGILKQNNSEKSLPKVRFACGVHPHYAKDYDENVQASLIEKLKDVRTSALGEVGLDYHYDFSPRKAQIEVFERQIEISKQMRLPIILHIREAFDDAFSVLKNSGFNEAGVLLHCYTSDSHEIERWLEEGVYVAFGGAFTFKKSEEIREAINKVPLSRLLTETDAPFMAPEPFRGCECVCAHTVFTIDSIWKYLKDRENLSREEFYEVLFNNAIELLDKRAKRVASGEM